MTMMLESLENNKTSSDFFDFFPRPITQYNLKSFLTIREMVMVNMAIRILLVMVEVMWGWMVD